jgi:hypothetical protein
METISSLRRRAELCLRLSEFCSDEVLANHLQLKAAEYHQRALRSEFDLRETAWFARPIVRH